MRDPLLAALLDVARAAGEVIAGFYEGPFHVEYKGKSDPVTEADRAANELICAELERRFPGVPVVAEESQPERYAGFRDAERVFFVDPLDGTRDFMQRNGEFVVMIGLLSDAAPSHGVILAPATGRAWCGAVGRGAWEVEGDTWRPIQASAVGSLAEARIVTSRSHRGEDLDRALERLGVREALALGSAGLKGAAVARSGADLYLATGVAGKRWDACAADALVSAAGGRYTDLAGRPLDYRGPSLDNDAGLLASNGVLHPIILERLQG